MAAAVAWSAISGRLPFAALVLLSLFVACIAQIIRSLVALYQDYRVSVVHTLTLTIV